MLIHINGGVWRLGSTGLVSKPSDSSPTAVKHILRAFVFPLRPLCSPSISISIILYTMEAKLNQRFRFRSFDLYRGIGPIRVLIVFQFNLQPAF